jgi:hypothetical protein
VNLLKASHCGYKGLGIIHERTFQTFEDHIIIDDKLSGNGKLPGKAGFHLAPGIIPTINGNRVKTHCAELEFNHAKSIFSEDCEIAVSFNQRARSIKIVVEFEEHLKTTITF